MNFRSCASWSSSLKCRELSGRFNPFQQLPDLADSLINHAFSTRFNRDEKDEKVWGCAEWNYFWMHVTRRLNPGGKFYLKINSGKTRCYHPKEIRDLFESRGATLERDNVYFARAASCPYPGSGSDAPPLARHSLGDGRGASDFFEQNCLTLILSLRERKENAFSGTASAARSGRSHSRYECRITSSSLFSPWEKIEMRVHLAASQRQNSDAIEGSRIALTLILSLRERKESCDRRCSHLPLLLERGED